MNDRARFEQAMQLGPLVLLRLRAEVLLDRIDEPDNPVLVSDEDRERLNRIASAPELDDREFLGTFDSIYEGDEQRDL
jgi:hypothetical protein